MPSKRLKYSDYFDKITGSDTFATIAPNPNASVIEKNASICYSIMQAHWVFRQLSEQYALPGFLFADMEKHDGPAYAFNYEDKPILGIKLNPNDNLFVIHSNLFDYIKLGWLPTKIKDWMPLAEQLMNDDKGNIFSA